MDAVINHLKTLGITHLTEWDVLIFIRNHGTSLASAEKIAGLLGYTTAAVGTALDALTSAGLIQRSRNSHGVRLYRFAAGALDDSQRGSLEELMKLTGRREGRLRIIRSLQEDGPAKELRSRGRLHLA